MRRFKGCRRGGVWLVLLAGLAVALPVGGQAERDSPLDIEANQAEFREQEGLTIYRGDVRMRQGGIVLRADELQIYAADGRVRRVVAHGRPAQYEQQAGPERPQVAARANSIDYRLESDLIQLREEASLTQEGATLSGEQITYDLRTNRLRADGGGERVRMRLPPLQPAAE
ncbi:MAG: lipopolysaccharide transport periplasmic protein LptA [Cellvibrionales bacterium]|nr:lipopolysaccharide transport periplasmic protein LptA [Cellvibrionales bacterium]